MPQSISQEPLHEHGQIEWNILEFSHCKQEAVVQVELK